MLFYVDITQEMDYPHRRRKDMATIIKKIKKGRPYYHAVVVCQHPRRAEVIGVVIIDLTIFKERNRLVGDPDVVLECQRTIIEIYQGISKVPFFHSSRN